MFKTSTTENKERLATKKPAPRTLCRAKLEFTVDHEGLVLIRDLERDIRWRASLDQVAWLLLCSFTDYEKNVRMLTYPPAEPLFRHSNTMIFEGIFPADQLIFQRLGLEYEIFPDQVARARLLYDDPSYLLGLVHESTIAGKDEVEGRDGDIILVRKRDVPAAISLVTPVIRSQKLNVVRQTIFTGSFCLMIILLNITWLSQHAVIYLPLFAVMVVVYHLQQKNLFGSNFANNFFVRQPTAVVVIVTVALAIWDVAADSDQPQLKAQSNAPINSRLRT